jgi:hypothetical protein
MPTGYLAVWLGRLGISRRSTTGVMTCAVLGEGYGPDVRAGDIWAPLTGDWGLGRVNSYYSSQFFVCILLIRADAFLTTFSAASAATTPDFRLRGRGGGKLRGPLNGPPLSAVVKSA